MTKEWDLTSAFVLAGQHVAAVLTYKQVSGA